jgi:hypothetical protein
LSRPCRTQESPDLLEARDFRIDRGKNRFRHSAVCASVLRISDSR